MSHTSGTQACFSFRSVFAFSVSTQTHVLVSVSLAVNLCLTSSCQVFVFWSPLNQSIYHLTKARRGCESTDWSRVEEGRCPQPFMGHILETMPWLFVITIALPVSKVWCAPSGWSRLRISLLHNLFPTFLKKGHLRQIIIGCWCSYFCFL